MRKIMFLFVCILMLAGTNASLALASTSSYEGVNKINTKDFYNIGKSYYYVYYYMEDCPYCNQVKEGMLHFAEKSEDVYFVDAILPENRCKRYDWNALMKKYNKIIGKVNEVGEIEFLPGESMEKYLGLINMYGKEMTYTFDLVTEDNIYDFEGAQLGDVVANIQTPEIDYNSMTSPEQLVLAGVPVLFHIVDGRIVNFYFDSPEIQSFLNELGM